MASIMRDKKLNNITNIFKISIDNKANKNNTKIKTMITIINTNKGQAIVELALVVSLFILFLLAGIIDFGYVMYNLVTLHQLANDAAQWAAESRGNIGVTSSAEVSEYVQMKRPTKWSTPIHVIYQNPILLPSGDKAVKVILNSYSPLLTPIYQYLAEKIAGKPAIPISVYAVYKIPLQVINR